MRIKFYLDYSDYRSYLMMHALHILDDLPVHVHWMAVDAYSLRALSGATQSGQTPLEKSFLRAEAVRYCQREGIDLVWHAEDIRCGSALQVGVWLMAHDDASFKTYSRRILDMVWGQGKSADAACIRSILSDLGLHGDDILKRASERTSFHFQDACLQEALADGVFDVPALLIGSEHIRHFDQANEILRLTTAALLRELPTEQLILACSALLMQIPKTISSPFLSNLVKKTASQQSIIHTMQNVSRMPLTLSAPRTPYLIPKPLVQTPTPLHIVAVKRGQSLADAIAMTYPGMVNLCLSAALPYHSESDLRALVATMSGERLVYARVAVNDTTALLRIHIDSNNTLHIRTLGINENDDYDIVSCLGLRVAAVSPNASKDFLMARFAATDGAHLIIRCHDNTALPVSETYGCMAHAWVAELSENGADLIDAFTHRLPLRPETSVDIDESFALSSNEPWMPTAPRTLLLFEKSFTFGSLDSNADIELGCRGLDLDVSAAGQSASLSCTRDFLAMKVSDEIIDLIPLNGDQLFIGELLMYRFIAVMNKAPRRSLPFFVNYWESLDFDRLKRIRPVCAVIAATLRVPVILVVGCQIIEIWLIPTHGLPYRIEKDDNCFRIDLNERATAESCPQNLLSTLNLDLSSFTARLSLLNAKSRTTLSESVANKE